MRWDAIIRGGSVVTPEGVVRADLAIADGRIAEVAPEIAGAAGEEIDGIGCHLLPGVIDPHVHFNDPGRADWEGLATGSARHCLTASTRAAAIGNYSRGAGPLTAHCSVRSALALSGRCWLLVPRPPQSPLKLAIERDSAVAPGWLGSTAMKRWR